MGAQTTSVLWLGMRQGFVVAALGTAFGLLGALTLATPFAPLLFDESPRDPLVYLLVTLAMLTVAAVASIVPAHRAASTDPIVTLRSE